MENIRLQKYISECGLCSRRAAEEMIREHRVVVNGVVAELGSKVDPSKDVITADGKRLRIPKQKGPITIAMHKPRGLICSHSDPFHEQTIYDIVPPHLMKTRLLCAGRLDKESEGLLILTSDGDLCQQLTHPSHGVIKRYRLRIAEPFNPSDIPALLKGVTRQGDHLYAKKVFPAQRGVDAAHKLEIHLSQGHKREIRRLMEAFGYRVKRLKRFQMGSFVMKRIPPGGVRVLGQGEIKQLLKAG